MTVTAVGAAEPASHDRSDGEFGPGCRGVLPLTARWRPWQDAVCRPHTVRRLLAEHGSPLHVHCLDPFRANVAELEQAAERHSVDFGVFFARKANKCLSYVEAARDGGFGVDLASEQELRQALEVGMPAERMVVTAAIKPDSLLELAVRTGVLVVLDNQDEACRMAAIAEGASRSARVAIRLGGFATTEPAQKMFTRFGFDVDEAVPVTLGWKKQSRILELEGLHFHLDGYSATDRVSALDQSLEIADQLRDHGLSLRFVDMGGGFPMSYLEDEAEWRGFWRDLEASLRGRREPITYRNHGYGLLCHRGEIIGSREAYPHYQRVVGSAWLSQILQARRPNQPEETVAAAFRKRRLELRGEPGRSLLDGCGMTLARVTHTKDLPGQRGRGGAASEVDLLVGLHMNGSNCRSKKSELFADPQLIATSSHPRNGKPRYGYLTGAYCTESDFISHRRFRFDGGVEPGDCLAFCNTAGYLMHFTESRSHQFTLPKNVVVGGEPELGAFELDAIDRPDHRTLPVRKL